MTLPRIPSLTLVVALAFTGACGSDSPSAPSDTGPTEITETIPSEPGTLTPNGGITHIFGVQQAGRILVALTTLAPDSTARIGLGLGSWDGSSCTQTIVNDAATQGTSILGEATATGNYCVRVYDPEGRLTQPLRYQLTVAHF